MSQRRIHSQRVKRAFARAAASYDTYAVLQREVADRLISHLEFTKIRPARILDIGCGTGYFTRLLQARFPRGKVHALDLAQAMLTATRASRRRRLPWQGRLCLTQGDAAALPYQDASFDLVCSNLTMQWVADAPRMMAEMRRVLAPSGLMLFSTFGRRTLIELRQSLAVISRDYAGLVLPFPDVTSLGDALMELPLELPVTDSDVFTLTYANPTALLRELKQLGASAAAITSRPQGLYGRAMLKKLEAIYAAEHGIEGGRVRATFEALYAQAWHAEPGFRHKKGVIPIEPHHG